MVPVFVIQYPNYGSNNYEEIINGENYINATVILLNVGQQFDDIDFIDIGGGFGISYDESEPDLDLRQLGRQLDHIFYTFVDRYRKKITFVVEPGRYICAECGILLTTVHSVKNNPGRTFIGTDGGFNVLIRPMAYGSYHEIINCNNIKGETHRVDICGNICESGDLLARDRRLTETVAGDILAVLDAGAYGYSMSSNYNARLRPAEVLVTSAGKPQLIRKRDSLEDLTRNQIF
ncbi:MAG TPA: hypothetical protein PKA28_05585 [Methylomusa anaerophila]|uniref:Diaminopimelate decarboxylase n=1 Tax=Methylomusa anaerophila TaxID=1930071 RepID=A0A348ALY5_9FIRM|nr:hypothetical protein [Methylomusa anaerophila]BBB92083.1 diaminopimelate decarboxylase [Methylomusa anaerophila]HML87904.1 hypothetical protein [Methylomusa anaerophila]